MLALATGEATAGSEMLGARRPARAQAVTPLQSRCSSMDEWFGRKLLSDQISNLAAGDESALAGIYRLTSAKLFGICLRILRDRAEAEEVLQEVYVTVWRKADAFDPARASPITWLVTIARNKAIDRLRARGGIRRADPIESAETVRDPGPEPLAQLEAADDQHRIEECLDELEARQAAAIRSAFLDGATYAELADRMNVPLGTMKSWIRRGLLKLRACLER